MTINLSEIYAGLKAWRDERRLTTESQKEGYIVNVIQDRKRREQEYRSESEEKE